MLRPRLLGPERRDMCADFSSDSASWWSRLNKRTPAACHAEATSTLSRLKTSLCAGFGLPGTHVLGAQSHLLRPDTAVLQIRSGDLFTAWEDSSQR